VEKKTNMTKWTLADIQSLPGRLAVVIGANSGIGSHAALEPAQAGSEVVLPSGTEAKGRDAVDRDAGMMVIHVVVAFRPGHPELSPRNVVFSLVKANGMLVAGSEGAAIHPAAAPREREPIVVKHRISPFVGAGLETLLRANGIETLALAGVHTSGVVLSAVCQAVDLDYRLVVVRDCCADPDAEAHAMLLDIVIAKQAAVVTTAEFAGALPGRSSRTNASR
jgi:nicotinamidase-related amidase